MLSVSDHQQTWIAAAELGTRFPEYGRRINSAVCILTVPRKRLLACLLMAQ